ncbi:PAS domain S-box protein [Candidatus Gracilibacteria bacterium]|nr:PAS domain S-box protein [Candidatus Gracilibacteria bacterium]
MVPQADSFAILQHINDAVLALDAELRVLFWNRACEAFFGWTAAEALGRKTTDLVELRYLDGSDRHDLTPILHAQHSTVREAILTRRDGSELWIEISSRVVRDADGTPLYIVAMAHDITIRQQARAAQTRLHILAEASRLFANCGKREHTAARADNRLPGVRCWGWLCHAAAIRRWSLPAAWHRSPSGHTASSEPQGDRFCGAGCTRRGDVEPGSAERAADLFAPFCAGRLPGCRRGRAPA